MIKCIFDIFQLVVGSMGWQTYCVLVPEETQEMCGKTVKLVRANNRLGLFETHDFFS